jgi:Fic family protein
MDPSKFKTSVAGRIVTCPEGYPAFVPAPLPPRLTFTRELAVALSRADAALGALSGLGDELPSPAAMAAPFLRQEALCSSRIEGADVSLTDVLLDEIAAAPAGSPLGQLAGVRNVLATLAYGVECVATAPLDLALVRSLHQRLLHGEAVAARGPGEFRTTQNWIGPPGATLATAAYVPPPVPQMNAALDRLEGFLAERDRLPDLVQCAMAHAQFESIHPFVDSNGRLGRILIVLFLVSRGRLSQPLLYLSAYLEAHRREYYTLLQRVRTHGDWRPWLIFFAEGVRETAERARVQVRLLLRQRERYCAEAEGTPPVLVDELFVSPFIAVRDVRRALQVSDGTARRAVRALESRGLITPIEGTRHPRVYVAPSILDAIEGPIEALVGEAEESPEGEPLKSQLGWDRRPRRVADRLMTEAMAMVDVARRAGVDVRLAGGLAVRRHCVDLGFIDREYSDIDLVGLSGQREALHTVFADLGYAENVYVSQATKGLQLQFVKKEALRAAPPEHPEQPGDQGLTGRTAGADHPESPERPQAQERLRVPARPLVDHVDVFLDVMRMDHEVDIRGRIDLDDYAISPVDTLISKAQIGTINRKDVHDLIALFKDLPLREIDDDLSICVRYIAEACAYDWGLYTDVTSNLQIVLDWLDDYDLSEQETAHVYDRVTAVAAAIEDEEKSLSWKVRARVGKRVAWRQEVEAQEATPLVVPEERVSD